MNTEERIELHPRSISELHDGLNQAIRVLQDLPQDDLNRCGILVTRHDPRHYTVALDGRVPYGEIREQGPC